MFSAFATVEGSLDRLPVPARTLRVSAAPTLATKWLAARLDRFQAAYPGILVSLSASNEMIDPGQDPSIDVALRYGPGPYPGVHAEKLLTNRLCVCAAPEVAEGLSSAADIAGQVLLRSAPPLAAATQQTPWAAWLAKAALPPAAERGPMFSNSQMAIEAAALGRGLALVPELLVADDVRTGRLAKPFSLTLDDPFSFWFVCGAERADSVALATFRRWLLREIAATLHPSGV